MPTSPPALPNNLSDAPASGTSTERFRIAAAMTVSYDHTEARKYNFDVEGAASIEADLVSVPAPSGLIDFLISKL